MDFHVKDIDISFMILPIHLDGGSLERCELLFDLCGRNQKIWCFSHISLYGKKFLLSILENHTTNFLFRSSKFYITLLSFGITNFPEEPLTFHNNSNFDDVPTANMLLPHNGNSLYRLVHTLVLHTERGAIRKTFCVLNVFLAFIVIVDCSKCSSTIRIPLRRTWQWLKKVQ